MSCDDRKAYQSAHGVETAGLSLVVEAKGPHRMVIGEYIVKSLCNGFR